MANCTFMHMYVLAQPHNSTQGQIILHHRSKICKDIKSSDTPSCLRGITPCRIFAPFSSCLFAPRCERIHFLADFQILHDQISDLCLLPDQTVWTRYDKIKRAQIRIFQGLNKAFLVFLPFEVQNNTLCVYIHTYINPSLNSDVVINVICFVVRLCRLQLNSS